MAGHTLRFDALYRGPVEEPHGSVQYFRFYEDGLVCSVVGTAEEEPSSVATWCHRDSPHAGTGWWTLDGDRLSFRDVTHGKDDLGDPETIAIDWSGRVTESGLALRAVGAHHVAEEQAFVRVR